MTSIVNTACNRDCPDACTLAVTVDASGRAIKLGGSRDDPITRGFLCERTGRFLARQYASDRITEPLLRRKGQLEPVSWDVALDAAAERLLAARTEHGPAAIMHYMSGGSLGILKATSSYLFEQFGPVTIKRGDICSGAGEWAQERDFGVADSHDAFDLLNSKTIVIWGKNPHVSGVHLLPILRDARAGGATIVGIDPVRTQAASLCETFIQPRPGGDAALALAIARWAFDHGRVHASAAERCDNLETYLALVGEHDVAGWSQLADVPTRDVEQLAERYVDAGPSAILVGWGMARRFNGAATVRAIDALAALVGHLGVPGGGASYYFGRRTAFDTDFVRGLDVAPRSLSEPCLGRELRAASSPPVDVVWVTAGNPVAMLPETPVVRAALAERFTIVVDTHPTDTTDVASLVLPTLTLLEDSDLVGAYGNHWLRESRPAVAPPASSLPLDPHAPGPRHELHILQGLAERLGLADVMAGSIDDWKRRVTKRLDTVDAGIDALRAGPVRNPFAREVLFDDGRVATASGKVQLLDRVPAHEAPADANFPLTLMAISTSAAQSSQWSIDLGDALASARVHPTSASGHADGSTATLESTVGAMRVTVVHDDTVRPGLVVLPKGGQLRDGRCANALIEARETDAGGGAALYDQCVRLVADEVSR